MKLLIFMAKACRRVAFFTITTALLSGVCNAGLIKLVNDVMNNPARAGAWMAGLFALLLLGKLLTNVASQMWLIRFTQQSIADMRLSLTRKILAVPLRRLESVGGPRLLVALTDDVNQISSALFSFPILSVNIAILLTGSLYLAWLSWKVLLVMGVFIVFAAALYRMLVASGFRSLHTVRETEDRLFGHFRSLIEGVKELKLHRRRRRVFVQEHLQPTTAEFQEHTVRAETRFILTHSWAHLLFFVLIGLLLFILPQVESIAHETLTGYILTTLYLMGPLAGVMGNLPILGRANAALKKIEELGLSLTDKEDCPMEQAEMTRDWKTLELREVIHTYRTDNDDNPFTLGPINLRFHRGELIFLVGGNGSGKSTLAKIITGLYPPEGGQILLDGSPVTDENRDEYRQIFSTVFSDYFLFESLLGLTQPELDAKAREYLAQLHLDRKVRVVDGAFSTTSLSAGQRKRLALLTAYLEDRSFFLFDEWASDQDPVFKRIFYTRILPDLKARGKTMLVITHDDQYFGLADEVIKLDYGRLVEFEPFEHEVPISKLPLPRAVS